MTRVAKIAAEDPALTVKLLQLVNSAFFGMPRKINSPLEAVILLGLKTLRAIVIACQLFEDVGRDTEDSTQLARLWGNSSRRFLSTNGGQPHERRKITSITDGR